MSFLGNIAQFAIQQVADKAQKGLDRSLAKRPTLAADLYQLDGLYLKISLMEQSGALIEGYIYQDHVHIGTPDPLINLTPTEISINPEALLHWLNGADSRALIREGVLTVTGDLIRLDQLQHILSNTDVDWNQKLEKHIGPAATGVVSHLFRQGREAAAHSKKRLTEDLELYLKEEIQILPVPEEAQIQFDAISMLRLDADRLEARIQQLKNKRASS